MARISGLEKIVTIVCMTQGFQSNNHHSAHRKIAKNPITNLQYCKASSLKSTNLIGLKSDHNLQVLTPFHLQSTTKF